MKAILFKLVMLIVSLLALAQARADQAGDFDYYVLALSWNAGFCALEEARGKSPSDLPEICDETYDYGFRLHGLWPQYVDGYPEFCQGTARNPSRADTRDQAGLFGSSGFAWHQWNKHGRCSGLSADAYYDTARELFEGFAQPAIFTQIDQTLEIDSAVIEDAVIEANPTLFDAAMSVTCRNDIFYELRVCLDRYSLEPIKCTGQLARDCAGAPAFLPIRR